MAGNQSTIINRHSSIAPAMKKPLALSIIEGEVEWVNHNIQSTISDMQFENSRPFVSIRGSKWRRLGSLWNQEYPKKPHFHHNKRTFTQEPHPLRANFSVTLCELCDHKKNDKRTQFLCLNNP